MGKEERRNISTADVTDQYRDNEAELKNLISLRDRLRDLLARAQEINEILAVEEQLNRIQTRIDQISGRQKLLNDQIAYTPITITANEERIYGPLGYIGMGAWWIVEKLFVIK